MPSRVNRSCDALVGGRDADILPLRHVVSSSMGVIRGCGMATVRGLIITFVGFSGGGKAVIILRRKVEKASLFAEVYRSSALLIRVSWSSLNIFGYWLLNINFSFFKIIFKIILKENNF